jgi:DNA modification methylase
MGAMMSRKLLVGASTCVNAKSRSLSVEYLSVQHLQADPENARVHASKQLAQIAKSIETFGFNTPVLVDSHLRIIAGHGRVAAAKMLKIARIPTIRLEHLTESQRRAFAIADNRLTENSTWDAKLLGAQFKMLAEAEINFSLEATGFEMAEIDLFIEGLSTASDDEEDPADCIPDESKAKPISKLGDLWQLGKHRVVCADSLSASSYEKLMNGKQANAVVADGPYNVKVDGHASGLGKTRHKNFLMASGEMSSDQFTTFLKQSMTATVANSAAGSIHYYFMDWRHMGEMLAAGNDVYSELKCLCVWAKDNAGMGSFYRSGHELVFVFKNGKESHRNNIQLGQFGRYRTNVWNYPSANSFSRSSPEGNLLALHPTVKPAALVADAIMDCTARGELVLDPFLGSGTTVIAAERTGRICYGLELDPKYVDTIVRRWQAFTGKSATLQRTGETFRSIEEALHGK